MIKSILIGSLMLLGIQVSAQLTLVKSTYFEAEKVLREAEMAMKPDLYESYKIEALGKEYIEGHFESPGKLDTALLNITIDKKAVETYRATMKLKHQKRLDNYYLNQGSLISFRNNIKSGD